MRQETENRKEQIVLRFFEIIDAHLQDLVTEESGRMMELREISRKLYCSQKYLIEIFRERRGHHPCHYYVRKIIDRSAQLLTETDWPIAEIARKLTYDPSNFSKFFKKYTGLTPGQFRTNVAVLR